MMKNAILAYLSPNRSTRHVALVIQKALADTGTAAPLAGDLSRDADRLAVLEAIQGEENPLLIIGSPVYRDLAVPPVMRFIDGLPPAKGGRAAVFATWGGANSGLALWQMAGALNAKGYAVMGAAKVLGVHSMMWTEAAPVGAGRPNAEDDAQVAAWARKLAAANGQPLSLEALRYQGEDFEKSVLERIDAPWAIIPKSIDPEACTACGTCASVCPVEAIAMDPGPVFGAACFDCFNCIRECPEEAISPAMPLAKIGAKIRERVAAFDEQPPTQVW